MDYKEPFPLYPGESLGKIEKLPIVARDRAIKLEAIRDFKDGDVQRVAGDEWIEYGPKIYIPSVSVKLVKYLDPFTICTNQALKVRALRDCVDKNGKERSAGEEWLIRQPGHYIPNINEHVLGMVDG